MEIYRFFFFGKAAPSESRMKIKDTYGSSKHLFHVCMFLTSHLVAARLAWVRVLRIAPLYPSLICSFKDSSFSDKREEGEEQARAWSAEKGKGVTESTFTSGWGDASVATRSVMHPLLSAFMFNHEPVDADPLPSVLCFSFKKPAFSRDGVPVCVLKMGAHGWSYLEKSWRTRLICFCPIVERGLMHCFSDVTLCVARGMLVSVTDVCGVLCFSQ